MSYSITDVIRASLPLGPQGPQGPQGFTGPQGPTGAAANTGNIVFNSTQLSIAPGAPETNISLNTATVVVSGNVEPATNNALSLGSPGSQWNQIHVSTANVSQINLSGNITATDSSTVKVGGTTTLNTSFISANVVISGPTETTYNTFTTTSDTPITIDSFSSSKFTTVKYIIQCKSMDTYHSTELFCMQDGISAYLTEYATLINNYTLGNYSMTVSGGVCNLVFDPNNPDNNIITVKLVRTGITI